MSLPSKAASASGVCLGDKGDIVFSDARNCSISGASFPILRGAWCLGCLLRLVSLLGPGSCRAMLIGCFEGFGPFRAVCVCVCRGDVWTVSKVSPSEVYPPPKLR